MLGYCRKACAADAHDAGFLCVGAADAHDAGFPCDIATANGQLMLMMLALHAILPLRRGS